MKVSIIVPAYNAEKTIKKCIKSLQKQTFKLITIILVNDGSTDKTGKICDDFSTKDGRITVIHKSNGGVVSARNAGINAIINKGDDDYTTFCDADDYLPSNAIEKW